MNNNPAKFKRILIKLSGEALAGDEKIGINPNIVKTLALEIKQAHDMGVEVAVVIGGGNIFRGSLGESLGMERTTGDYMGMLATVINSLALQDAVEKLGLFSRVMTAIDMHSLAEPYIRRRAVRHLEKGRIVILAAGTGNPFFTTDTAASLRAIELNAEILLKATKVDGVYDKDPMKHKDAVRIDRIKYYDVIEKQLKVMDLTAISLCMDNNLPIMVFDLFAENSIVRALQGEEIGTIID